MIALFVPSWVPASLRCRRKILLYNRKGIRSLYPQLSHTISFVYIGISIISHAQFTRENLASSRRVLGASSVPKLQRSFEVVHQDDGLTKNCDRANEPISILELQPVLSFMFTIISRKI
jgi:hypothetical protein